MRPPLSHMTAYACRIAHLMEVNAGWALKYVRRGDADKAYMKARVAVGFARALIAALDADAARREGA